MDDNVSGDEPRAEVRLTIIPTSTPARELPFGMVFDVCTVLEAYGLKVKAPEFGGHGVTEVMLALVRVIDVTPVELGGRAEQSRWLDTGTGPGYIGKTIPPIEGLHDSGDDAGTAWERHDDPEADR